MDLRTISLIAFYSSRSFSRWDRCRCLVLYSLFNVDKEAAIAREQLEKDLQSTKAQLKESSPSRNDDSKSNGRPRNLSSSDFTSEPDVSDPTFSSLVVSIAKQYTCLV